MPPKEISKEELWYPVTFAQRKKEQEEEIWLKNNPNASLAEMMYPSMRKKDAPQAVAETPKQAIEYTKQVEQAGQTTRPIPSTPKEQTLLTPQGAHSVFLPHTNLNYAGKYISDNTTVTKKLVNKNYIDKPRLPKNLVNENYAGKLIPKSNEETWEEKHIGMIDLVEIDPADYETNARRMNSVIAGFESEYLGKVFGLKTAEKPENMKEEEDFDFKIGQSLSNSPRIVLPPLATIYGGPGAGVAITAAMDSHNAYLTTKDASKALKTGGESLINSILTQGVGSKLSTPLMKEMNDVLMPTAIEFAQQAWDNPEKATVENWNTIFRKYVAQKIMLKNAQKPGN